MAHAVPQARSRIFVYVCLFCSLRKFCCFCFAIPTSYNSTLSQTGTDCSCFQCVGQRGRRAEGIKAVARRARYETQPSQTCGQRARRVLSLCTSYALRPVSLGHGPKHGTVSDKDRRSKLQLCLRLATDPTHSLRRGQVVWQLYSP